jgi:hypothetical protein
VPTGSSRSDPPHGAPPVAAGRHRADRLQPGVPATDLKDVTPVRRILSRTLLPALMLGLVTVALWQAAHHHHVTAPRHETQNLTGRYP